MDKKESNKKIASQWRKRQVSNYKMLKQLKHLTYSALVFGALYLFFARSDEKIKALIYITGYMIIEGIYYAAKIINNNQERIIELLGGEKPLSRIKSEEL